MNANLDYIDQFNNQQEQQQVEEQQQIKQYYSVVEAQEPIQTCQTPTNIKQLESNQYYNNIINPIKIQKTQQGWQLEITKQLQMKCLQIEMLKKTFNKTYKEIIDVVKGKVFIFNGYMFLRSKYLLEDDIEQAIRDSLLMIAAGCMNEELQIGKFTGGQVDRLKYQQTTQVQPYLFYKMCQQQDLFVINPLDDIVFFNYNNDIEEENIEEERFLDYYRENECVEIIRKLKTIKVKHNEQKQFEKLHIQLIE